MNLPSNSLYKETLSVFLQVGVKKPTGEPRFAMLPADVLRRTDLSATAKIVLAAMAMESYSSGKVSISHQAIATTAGVSRPQVLYCLKVLEGKGLIEADGTPVKQVQPYRLLHARLCARSRREAVPEVKGRSPVRCPRCGKSRQMLLKVGWCRSCGWELKVRKIAQEEISGSLVRAKVG